jgi:hypothetical protein
MPKLNISTLNRNPIHRKREMGSSRSHPATLQRQDGKALIWLEINKFKKKYQGGIKARLLREPGAY